MNNKKIIEKIKKKLITVANSIDDDLLTDKIIDISFLLDEIETEEVKK